MTVIENNYRCRVKICGVTREEDVDAVCAAGADYIGFLVNINSPRSNTPDRAAALARRAAAPTVLLFLDAATDLIFNRTMQAEPAAIQLHGDEPPQTVKLLRRTGAEIWKALHIPMAGAGAAPTAESLLNSINDYVTAGADKILLDTVVTSGEDRKTGGTGKIHDWNLAAEIVRRAPCPVIVAGGITPENSAAAVRAVHPYSLDVSSGVERSKGVKDTAKIQSLIANVKSVV